MKLPKTITDKIKKAKNLNNEVSLLKAEIFNDLEHFGIDPSEFEGGANSDDLDQLIQCYIDYDDEEFNLFLNDIKKLEEV